MNSELKSKWTNALFSGQYKQTIGTLRKIEGEQLSYCCLGVLCDISGEGNWRKSYNGRSAFAVEVTEDGQTYIDEEWDELSMAMLDLFGLTTKQAENLISMNDDKRYSFEQIAQWIESNL